MVLEILSPATFNVLSPQTRATQEGLKSELDTMTARFPDHKKKTLTRFLMGFGMSAEKAIPAYEAHLKWREENLPISRESVLKELKTGRFYFHGADKEGRPVAYYSLANHNPKNRDLPAIFRMMAYQIEQALETMPDSVSGFTIIWDTRHTTMKNTDSEFLREFLAFFRAQYPEVLCRMLIAPVGILQRGVWKVACRFVDERRASRIKMVPTIEGLKRYIEEEELLATHGGKNPWTFDATLI